MALWDSGIREARLLASYTEEPMPHRPQTRPGPGPPISTPGKSSTAGPIMFAEAGLGGTLIAEFAARRPRIRPPHRLRHDRLERRPRRRRCQTPPCLPDLPLIEAHATDPRNFVRKAVNWALRQIGKRNATCHAPALALAERLADSPPTRPPAGSARMRSGN